MRDAGLEAEKGDLLVKESTMSLATLRDTSRNWLTITRGSEAMNRDLFQLAVQISNWFFLIELNIVEGLSSRLAILLKKLCSCCKSLWDEFEIFDYLLEGMLSGTSSIENA